MNGAADTHSPGNLPITSFRDLPHRGGDDKQTPDKITQL